MSLLSDVCELTAQRAALALHARASTNASCEPGELLALSRLLQLCALELTATTTPDEPGESGDFERVLAAARRDAAVVDEARQARTAWTREASDLRG